VTDHKYDNEVQPDNKFGHTLELLARHLPENPAGGVHLDIACGFGHIAEPLVDAHGVHYVGVDIDEAALEDVRSRGLEAHVADLGNDGASDALLKILTVSSTSPRAPSPWRRWAGSSRRSGRSRS
jgi:2-polyprenyl-3-methyl-5-hydroxy-6-metoxy-1,4-benzoquinol methylase